MSVGRTGRRPSGAVARMVVSLWKRFGWGLVASWGVVSGGLVRGGRGRCTRVREMSLVV